MYILAFSRTLHLIRICKAIKSVLRNMKISVLQRQSNVALFWEWVLNVFLIKVNACRVIRAFVACLLFYQILCDYMFHKKISFVAHLSLRWNLLKSMFSHILRNLSLRIYLMLFVRWFVTISLWGLYRNNLSNFFHSVGLVLHRNFLQTFYLLEEDLTEYLLFCITWFHHL